MRVFALCLLALTACTASTDVPADSSNTCVTDSDCPRDTNCLLSQCRTKVCEPGALRCNDSDLEACTADGQGFAFNRACAAGCDAENSRCREAICAAFATRCFEGNKERCVAGGGGWVLEEECDEGCVEGTAWRRVTDLLRRTDPLRRRQRADLQHGRQRLGPHRELRLWLRCGRLRPGALPRRSDALRGGYA